MKIPWGTPSVSSATAIGYTNLEQSILGLLLLDVTPAGASDFSSGWTEFDPDGKVNISGGVASLDGSNTFNTHGLLYSATARGVLFFEIEFKHQKNSAANNLHVSIENAAALSIGGNDISVNASSGGTYFYNGSDSISTGALYVKDVWYKLRMYVGKSNDGTSWKRSTITVQGGAYTAEKVVYCMDQISTAYAASLYFAFQRYVSDSNDIVQLRYFKIYSGYSSASPYIEWIADAGVGKTWQNFDRTLITFDAGFPTTNMTFSDSFDDGVENYSVAANLATWQAVGKTTANRRYIRLRAYLISDGNTFISAPVCGPNSTTATDIKDYSAAEEAARNKFNTGTTVADIAKDKSIKLLNEDHVGTLEIYSAPDVPTINLVSLSSSSIRINFTWAALMADISIERSSDGLTGWTEISDPTSGNYFDDTGLSAATNYYYRARAHNDQGYSGYTDIAHASTKDEAAIPEDTSISQLLQSIRNAILDIYGFTGSNVQIGEITDLDQRKSTGFPCAEIFPARAGGRGENYESQRTISGLQRVQIYIHQYVETASRKDGTDIKSLSLLGSAVIRQLYRFNDNAQNGNPPCDGFIMVNPDYGTEPMYELVSENVNTQAIDIGFRIDTNDTEL